MNLERKSVPFLIESKSDDGAEFSGYAACFHNIDAYGDIIAPGAFADTLDQFLADGIVAWQHDWAEPIGKPLAASEDARGLFTKARISDTQAGRDARTLMKDGVVKKLSIGFRTTGREWLETAADVGAYWAGKGYTPTADDLSGARDGGIRLITKARLYEYSVVSIPANSGCDITQVKAAESGAHGARSFADHSLLVLDLAAEYVERAQSYAATCADEPRALSPQRKAEFRRLRDALSVLLDTQAPIQRKLDGAVEFARYQATLARLNGAMA